MSLPVAEESVTVQFVTSKDDASIAVGVQYIVRDEVGRREENWKETRTV